MTTLREAARQALEAIEQGETFDYLDKIVSPRLLAALDLPERRLTDEVIAELWYKNGTHHHHFAHAIERWLKGEQ